MARRQPSPTIDQTAACYERLTTAAATFTNSAQFRAYLRQMTYFHRYSTSNQLLIWLQQPTASAINSYRRWQQLRRQVRQGETAIRILAPCAFASREQPTDLQPAEEQSEERTAVRFRAVPVFAYEQTDPIPDFAGTPWEPLTFPELTEESGHAHYAAVRDVLTARGIPVHEEASHDDYAGFYDPQAHAITLCDRDAPMLARLRTLIHETAHALHFAEHQADARSHTSAYREIVAEASTYAVCAALGYDTTTASAPYVGVHALTDPTAIVEALCKVRTIVHDLLTALETSMAAPEALAA